MPQPLERQDRDHHLVLYRRFEADWGIRGVPAFGIHRDRRTRTHPIPDHLHPDGLEINYQARGTQRYEIGDQKYLLEPDTVYVVPPGTPHGSRGEKQALGLTYYLELDLKARSFLGFQPGVSAPLLAMLSGLGILVFPGGPRWQGLFETLAEACSRDGVAASFAIRQSLLGIIGALLDARPQVAPRLLSAPIKRAVRIIEGTSGMPSMDALCKSSGLSYSRFSHRFSREMGESPKAFLLRHHIERAQKLLFETGKTVHRVAEEAGFDSLKAFYLHFRKWSGMTPQAYRKQAAGPGRSKT